MRISGALFAKLFAAINDMPQGANERQRWDALWRAVDAGRFNVLELYAEGLSDAHIDTALRRIAAARASCILC